MSVKQLGHKQYNTGRTRFKKGRLVSDVQRIKISDSLKKQWKSGLRKLPKGFTMKGRVLSKEQRTKMSEIRKKNPNKYWLYKKRPEISGKNHYNWKGGTTYRDLTTREYKEWRISVFKRDNFTCLNCGKVGGNLEAHHILRWVDYPKLRFVVDNGATLCRDCHNLTKRKK